MEDKRRSHRLDIQLSARISSTDPASTLTGEALVLNVNAKGMCFIVDQELSSGQLVKLEVDLTDEENLKVTAKVVWVKPSDSEREYAIGVQVVDSTSGDEAKFVRFYANKLIELTGEESLENG